MNCLKCENEAVWIRHTQFAGNHPFCNECARGEKDFGKESPYYFWGKREPIFTNCRCECCIYWRRHVHRVASNRERITSKALKELEWTKSKLYNSKYETMSTMATCDDKIKTIRMLRMKIGDLKMEILNMKKPSILKRIFG